MATENRILYFDSFSNSIFERFHLEGKGIAVDQPTSIEEALRLAQQREYSALVVDPHFGIDYCRPGTETPAVALIRQFREKKLPVVLAASCRPEEIDQMGLTETDYDDLYHKPFNGTELCERLMALLKGTQN